MSALTGIVLLAARLRAAVTSLPPVVKAWFPDQVGPVAAAHVSMIAIGTALPANLAVPVADRSGWRAGLAVWGWGRALPRRLTNAGTSDAVAPPATRAVTRAC